MARIALQATRCWRVWSSEPKRLAGSPASVAQNPSISRLLELSGTSASQEAGDLAAIDGAVEAIQRAMSQYVAVVRSAEGLRSAAAEVAAQLRVLDAAGGSDRVAVEARNIAQAAAAVIDAALSAKKAGEHTSGMISQRLIRRWMAIIRLLLPEARRRVAIRRACRGVRSIAGRIRTGGFLTRSMSVSDDRFQAALDFIDDRSNYARGSISDPFSSSGRPWS